MTDLPRNADTEARYATVKVRAWWWKRCDDGRVLVGFGSEYSTYLTAAQWDEVVATVGPTRLPHIGSSKMPADG
jgi:hypothetical protein